MSKYTREIYVLYCIFEFSPKFLCNQLFPHIIALTELLISIDPFMFSTVFRIWEILSFLGDPNLDPSINKQKLRKTLFSTVMWLLMTCIFENLCTCTYKTVRLHYIRMRPFPKDFGLGSWGLECHIYKKSQFLWFCIYLKQFRTAEKAAIFWENVTKNLLFSLLWYLIFSVLTNCELDPDPHSNTYSTVFWKLPPVLRVHDILVWFRVRGSMPLTNGFGSGFRIRILTFSSLTFKRPTKN